MVFDDFTAVVLDRSKGDRIATALGPRKAVILLNHDILTAGPTVEAAAWWFVAMDNAARTQLLAEAAGAPRPIPAETARLTACQVGSARSGLLSVQPMLDWIVAQEPELLD